MSFGLSPQPSPQLSPQLSPQERSGAAQRLGVSEEAVALSQDAEIIDLHIDTFIPVRLFGYDLEKRHERRVLPGRFFGHLDLPRMSEGGVTGAMWSITTNPFRTPSGRWRAFVQNLSRLQAQLEAASDQVAIVKDARGYREARAKGLHACMLAVQGGNCFDAAPAGVRSAPEGLITRVTIVHLTTSALGVTSTPTSRLRRSQGLSMWGREFVQQLNEARVFVDLAHIHPRGFWDAVAVHDKTQPLIVTHTGVCGVTPRWRNLDDQQLEAIAKTGGTVGIIFQRSFLSRRGGPDDADMVLEHMEHVIKVVGEDHISVGSDYDGAITPPRGLEGGQAFPRLIQRMLDRGWGEVRIRKALGENFLRAFELLRPA